MWLGEQTIFSNLNLGPAPILDIWSAAGFRIVLAALRLGVFEALADAPLPAGARRLLDVGGGHSAYSVAFCRRYPALAATVLDRPPALNTARANVTSAGLLERLTLQAGDFLAGDLGEGYNVALIFNTPAPPPGACR